MTVWKIEFAVYAKRYELEANGDDAAELILAQIKQTSGARVLDIHAMTKEEIIEDIMAILGF